MIYSRIVVSSIDNRKGSNIGIVELDCYRLINQNEVDREWIQIEIRKEGIIIQRREESITN